MNSPTLLVMVNPDNQYSSTGYDTWTLTKLLQYNRDALAAGRLPQWIPIEAVEDAASSRRFVETRLARLRR